MSYGETEVHRHPKALEEIFSPPHHNQFKRSFFALTQFRVRRYV